MLFVILQAIWTSPKLGTDCSFLFWARLKDVSLTQLVKKHNLHHYQQTIDCTLLTLQLAELKISQCCSLLAFWVVMHIHMCKYSSRENDVYMPSLCGVVVSVPIDFVGCYKREQMVHLCISTDRRTFLSTVVWGLFCCISVGLLQHNIQGW